MNDETPKEESPWNFTEMTASDVRIGDWMHTDTNEDEAAMLVCKINVADAYTTDGEEDVDNARYVFRGIDTEDNETTRIVENASAKVFVDSCERYLTVDMEVDRTTWAIPATWIAWMRARHYAREFEDDVLQSYLEDSWALLKDDDYSVKDWATGSFNWKDIEHVAFKIDEPAYEPDYASCWVGSHKAVINERPEQV